VQAERCDRRRRRRFVLQCIYNYIPVTNHVSGVHSVAAVLYLQSVLHVMLFRMLNMFCTFTLVLLQYLCSAQYGCFFAVP
jgi:hypothetical protein